MFRVGQKVVCVNAGAIDRGKPLVRNRIYTIRAIQSEVARPQRGVGLFLEEVVNGLHPSGKEYGYYSDRFRPVVERKTDISCLKALLNPSVEDMRKIIREQANA